jgi:hypothetical protein
MVGGFLALCGVGCLEDQPSTVPAMAVGGDPYALAETQFSAAFFLKPTRDLEGREAFVLAPLIIQYAGGDDDTLERRLFGGASFENGELRSSSTPAIVYFVFSTVEIHGRPHRQVTYRWWYPEVPGRAAIVGQGLRMTLDDTGQPVLWEILFQAEGQRFIVASTPLEEAAVAEFGAPLAERRFALERPLGEYPDVFVLRVIAPGPVPMGPFVYLGDPVPTPVTVLCRCMPSQFDALRGDGYYELAPMAQLGNDAAGGLPDELEAMPLEECLRLPATF